MGDAPGSSREGTDLGENSETTLSTVSQQVGAIARDFEWLKQKLSAERCFCKTLLTSDKTCQTEGAWKTIIVNQIPINVDYEKLISRFSSYGIIENTYLCKPVEEGERWKLKHERTGRITFSKAEDAWRVMEASKENLIKYDDNVLMITVVSDDYSPIQNLPDICLREIFQRVDSVRDLFNIEMVCKRWKKNARSCWSNVTEISTENFSVMTWRVILFRVGDSLENIDLELERYSEAYLRAVAEHCVRLKKLTGQLSKLDYAPCAPQMCMILQRNRNLRTLKFYFVEVKNLYFNLMEVSSVELKEIDLGTGVGVGVETPGTLVLSKFPNLRSLGLQQFIITNPELIDDVVNLDRLMLSSWENVESHASRFLRKNQGLKYLHIAPEDLNPTLWMSVRQLRNLQVLVVEAEEIVDAYLGQVSSLKGLFLKECPSITDEGIRKLFHSAPNITRLTIWRCSITLESTVIARQWTIRTGKSVKLSIDGDLFEQYQASGWLNTESLQVIKCDPNEMSLLDNNEWAVELIE